MRRKLRHLLFTFVVLLAATWAAAGSAVELYLTDGQVVSGSDLWLEAGNYLIQDDEGRVVAVPADLVARLAIVGETQPSPAATAEDVTAEPDDETTSAFVNTPRVLAGRDVEFPRVDESLAVLGEPARFARGVVPSTWRPESGWREPGSADFAPSRWPRSIIDPYWRPKSGFRVENATAGRRSRWQRGILDSTWVPVDGFRGGF